MVPFLDNVLRNLPAIQSKQVLRILSQMRDRGEIRTHKEFQKKLTELSKLISKNEFKQRSPALAMGEGELLESDAVRTFLELVQLDLEAALGESERLSNISRAHHRILTENYFDAIEAAVEELEAEARAYEVLDVRRYNGFSSVYKIYNFAGAVGAAGADRNDSLASSLFVDERGGQELILSPPKGGEMGMHLGLEAGSAERTYYFDSVEVLTDSTTPATAFNTSPEENKPYKAIDGNRDTAWRYSVLLSDYVDTCRLKLGLSFSAARRVNAIVIDPLADINVKVADISYVDSGGEEHELNIGSNHIGSGGYGGMNRRGHLPSARFDRNDFVAPNRRLVFPVGDIIASKIVLTLQQDTALDGEFFYDVFLNNSFLT